VYPKVSGLAGWSENCRWYSSPPLGAVVSLFMSQSREFCRHNPLCCFSTSGCCCCCCCCLFRYSLTLWSIRSPIQWVPGALSLWIKRPEREANHSLPSSDEVKECVELYTPPYAFMAWCLVKHRDNFTFTSVRKLLDTPSYTSLAVDLWAESHS
jgi:hypothetical protein